MTNEEAISWLIKLHEVANRKYILDEIFLKAIIHVASELKVKEVFENREANEY